MKLTILNTREIKRIKKRIIDQFNYFPEGDYAFLKNSKEKLFIVNKDISRIQLNNLRIDRLGLYFAELKINQVRLSKEGAQLLVREAVKNKQSLKNTLTLTKEEIKQYFKGEDLEKDMGIDNRFVLLLYGKNCLGCAKYKDKRILNFLPKIHRREVVL